MIKNWYELKESERYNDVRGINNMNKKNKISLKKQQQKLFKGVILVSILIFACFGLIKINKESLTLECSYNNKTMGHYISNIEKRCYDKCGINFDVEKTYIFLRCVCTEHPYTSSKCMN